METTNKKLADRITKGGNFKHGLTDTPLFRAWSAIKSRCYNKKAPPYKRYGGRGITMCKEWRNDVVEFYNWAIANGWEMGLQIDRINNDGNYEPGNCRFVTAKENSNNRSGKKTNRAIASRIRALYHATDTGICDIASVYGISPCTTSLIIHNKIWKDINYTPKIRPNAINKMGYSQQSKAVSIKTK